MFSDVLETTPKKSWRNILAVEEKPIADKLYERVMDLKSYGGQTMTGTEFAALLLKRRRRRSPEASAPPTSKRTSGVFADEEEMMFESDEGEIPPPPPKKPRVSSEKTMTTESEDPVKKGSVPPEAHLRHGDFAAQFVKLEAENVELRTELATTKSSAERIKTANKHTSEAWKKAEGLEKEVAKVKAKLEDEQKLKKEA
ncbi:hypothetical protein QYE76_002293 [Lolium multiflorum]|uniref:Uncharacterized protein n=1 Tax=Lolium multiflorum TaxID=4521 RepID=A0AAD8W050_LOLMU|nr:hypothetical protein QYE76_002293 [Lolium multiflorum]